MRNTGRQFFVNVIEFNKRRVSPSYEKMLVIDNVFFIQQNTANPDLTDIYADENGASSVIYTCQESIDTIQGQLSSERIFVFICIDRNGQKIPPSKTILFSGNVCGIDGALEQGVVKIRSRSFGAKYDTFLTSASVDSLSKNGLPGNFVAQGRTLNYVVPSEQSVAAGSLVSIGNIVGVAQTEGAAGETVVLSLDGIWEFNTGGSIDAGDRVFYATPDSVDLGPEGAFVGMAIADSLAGKVRVRVISTGDGAGGEVLPKVQIYFGAYIDPVLKPDDYDEDFPVIGDWGDPFGMDGYLTVPSTGYYDINYQVTADGGEGRQLDYIRYRILDAMENTLFIRESIANLYSHNMSNTEFLQQGWLIRFEVGRIGLASLDRDKERTFATVSQRA